MATDWQPEARKGDNSPLPANVVVTSPDAGLQDLQDVNQYSIQATKEGANALVTGSLSPHLLGENRLCKFVAITKSRRACTRLVYLPARLLTGRARSPAYPHFILIELYPRMRTEYWSITYTGDAHNESDQQAGDPQQKQKRTRVICK